MPDVDASYYGASAPALEALRRLVEVKAPSVRFRGFNTSGARFGEYRFQLPPCAQRTSASVSVCVQAPLTPSDRLRVGLGLWRYRLAHGRGAPHPWRYAAKLETVVEWIEKAAKGACY